MKNNIIKIAYVFLLSFFVGCKDFVTDEVVIGRYHLIAIEIEEDLTLCYKLENGDYVGILGETIFAIGFNDNYIIAKQHPSNNRAITNYFIVPIYKENTFSPERGIIGSLTLEEFNEKRKELHIPDNVTFTKEIEDLK